MEVNGKQIRLDRLIALGGSGLSKRARNLPGKQGKFIMLWGDAGRSRSRLGGGAKIVKAFFRVLDTSSKNSDEWTYEEISPESDPQEFAILRDVYYREVNPSAADIARGEYMRASGTGGHKRGADSDVQDRMVGRLSGTNRPEGLRDASGPRPERPKLTTLSSEPPKVIRRRRAS